LYARLLRQAREVSAQTVDRVCGLHERFPASLPRSLVEQLARVQADPAGERRRAVRVNEPGRVLVRPEGGRRLAEEATATDHSPGGLALRLTHPVPVGSILEICSLDSGDNTAWSPVEVRYCRPHGAGWMAGCAVVGSPPHK
jgi:hypothetical protein